MIISAARRLTVRRPQIKLHFSQRMIRILSYKLAGFVSFSKQSLNSAGADTRNTTLQTADAIRCSQLSELTSPPGLKMKKGEGEGGRVISELKIYSYRFFSKLT